MICPTKNSGQCGKTCLFALEIEISTDISYFHESKNEKAENSDFETREDGIISHIFITIMSETKIQLKLLGNTAVRKRASNLKTSI